MNVIKFFSVKEEIANSVLHGIGAILSIVFLVLLIIKSVTIGTAWHIVSYTIFGATLLILYTMSTIYHSLPKGTAKNVFERFDHISIYLLIAGTYTPFCFTILRGSLGWTIFGIQWGIALLGIIFKSIWIKKYNTFSTFLYVVMGWVIVFAIKPPASASAIDLSSIARYSAFLLAFIISLYSDSDIITMFSFLGRETINVSPLKTLSHNDLKFSLTSMLFTANIFNTSFPYKKSYVFSYLYYMLLLCPCQLIS